MPINKIKNNLTNAITSLYVRKLISDMNRMESGLLDCFIDYLSESFTEDNIDYIINNKIYRKNNTVKPPDHDYTKFELIKEATSIFNSPKIIIHNEIDEPKNKLLILTNKSEHNKIHEELESMTKLVQKIINNPKHPFLLGASIIFYQEKKKNGSLLVKYSFGINTN